MAKLYTESTVKRLLKEQREICAKDHFADKLGNRVCWRSHVLAAPSPLTV